MSAQLADTIEANRPFRIGASYQPQQGEVPATELRLRRDGIVVAVVATSASVEFPFPNGLTAGVYAFIVEAVYAGGVTAEAPTLTLTVGDPPPPNNQTLSIASVTPPSGPATGGTAVTVLGTGFTSEMTVTLCALSDQVSFVSATEVRFTTPPCGTEGPTTVTLTRRADSATVTAVNAFTYGTGGGQACTYALAPTSIDIPTAGGNGTIAVTTSAACAWTVTNTASWLGASPLSGTGNGSIAWTAPANTSTTARTGTLAVQGQAIPVTQEGAPPPLDPCAGDPLRVTRVAWPGDNTGRRSITFDVGTKRWARFTFVWPGTLTVTDTRGCTATVSR